MTLNLILKKNTKCDLLKKTHVLRTQPILGNHWPVKKQVFQFETM